MAWKSHLQNLHEVIPRVRCARRLQKLNVSDPR